MPDAQKDILIRYLVEAKGAIDESERLRLQIEGVKKQLMDFGATKSSIDEVAQSIKRGFKADQIDPLLEKLKVLRNEIDKLRTGGDISFIPQENRERVMLDPTGEISKRKEEIVNLQNQLVEAKRGYQELSTASGIAVAEMKKGWVQADKETAQSAREAKNARRQAAKEAADAEREYVQATKSGYKVMSDAAKEYGKNIQDIKEKIKQISKDQGVSFTQAGQQLAASGTPIKDVNVALGEMQSKMTSLGQVAQYVFGTVFGMTVIGILRQVFAWLVQAAQAGKELAQAFFQLEVGVRVLRRSGMEITSKEMLDNLEMLREKYKIFTTKELVVGAAAFANLIRDLGFTRDQFFALQEAVAQLAIINGRSMDEVQRTVALALSSGYTEGLQRLGVSINRVTIAARAAAMGWRDGYTALTEYQRGQATASLLLEKTAKYQDDLNKYLETFPGMIDASDAAVEQYSDVLGNRLLPLLVAWSKIKIAFIEDDFAKGLAKWIGGAGILLDEFMNRLELNAEYAPRLWNAIFGIETIREVWDEYKAKEREIFKNSERLFNSLNEATKKGGFVEWDIPLGTDNPIEPFSQGIEEGATEIEDTVKDLADKLFDIEADLQERLAALARDYTRDINAINRQLFFDISQLDKERNKKIDEIIEDGVNKKAKIERDYNQAVADANYESAKRIEEIQYNFREKQIQEEIRFQERMRQIQDSFFFDLDDALRERDARQIIQVLRRNAREKDEAKRQHEQAQAENKRQYDREVAEAAEASRRRLEILAREYQDRLDDLKDTLEREKKEEEDAARDRLKKLTDRADFARSERKIKWTEQQEEEKARADERVKRLAEEFQMEVDLTTEYANMIADELAKVLGPGGRVEQLRDNFFALIESISAAYSSLGSLSFNGSISAPDPSKFEDSPSGSPLIPQSPGGTSPFPLNLNLPTQTELPSGVESDAYSPVPSLQLQVSLSPDLIPDIINDAVGTVADVIVTTQRRSP